MNTLFVMLQAAATGDAKSSWLQMLPLLLIFVVFYFFFILPQTRKSKAQKKFREALKKGDKIVTIGGIHGKISEIKEKTAVIEVGNGIKMTVEKSAISMDNETIQAK